MSSRLSGSGTGPSPAIRNPGSTTRAASPTQRGFPPNGLPNTTPRMDLDLSGNSPLRSTLIPGSSSTSAGGLTAIRPTPGLRSDTCPPGRRRPSHQHHVAARPAQPHERRQRLRGEERGLGQRGLSTAEIEHALLHLISAPADRASQAARADRALLHLIGQEHEIALLMVRRAPQVVGELDEHQGEKTTQVTLPGATVTSRSTRFPSISVPIT